MIGRPLQFPMAACHTGGSAVCDSLCPIIKWGRSVVKAISRKHLLTWERPRPAGFGLGREDCIVVLSTIQPFNEQRIHHAVATNSPACRHLVFSCFFPFGTVARTRTAARAAAAGEEDVKTTLIFRPNHPSNRLLSPSRSVGRSGSGVASAMRNKALNCNLKQAGRLRPGPGREREVRARRQTGKSAAHRHFASPSRTLLAPPPLCQYS